MSCSIGHQSGSDMALLWLCRRSAAEAPIQPLAWVLPYAAGVPPQKKETMKPYYLCISVCMPCLKLQSSKLQLIVKISSQVCHPNVQMQKQDLSCTHFVL